MSHDLESPYREGVLERNALYRARGDEVSGTRPIFTGDVFTGVPLPGWTGGNFNLMPLPGLRPEMTSQARDQAANFDNLYTVAPELLTSRIASLSPFGVNLLLQRWVHFNSRVVVPTQTFNEQTVAYYEEADLIEEWCDETGGDDLRQETVACLDWLRADRDGSTFQELLKSPQTHSMIRRAMRQVLKERKHTQNEISR